MAERHFCDPYMPEGAYGPAIEHCLERDDGTFWAGNGEYDSQVAYCPFCGARAPVQPSETG